MTAANICPNCGKPFDEHATVKASPNGIVWICKETTVPRVASSLDDLRVGQVVAWLPNKYGFDESGPRQCIGTVEMRNGIRILRYHADNGGGYDTIGFNDALVVILSDPPPEPVTVSREAFDRLASATERWLNGHADGAHLAGCAVALLDEVRGQTDVG